MKNMTLENIATVCGVYHGDPAKSKQEVTNIVIDSRKIEPGGLFIATKGERVDGHSFIGAGTAGCGFPLYSGKGQLYCAETDRCLLSRAAFRTCCGHYRKCWKDEYKRNDSRCAFC